jgi:DNA-binding transcriptional LysR family regulator
MLPLFCIKCDTNGETTMITINQLIAAIAAGKYLNITRASKALCISQSSVSKHLRLLENEYNFKLHEKKKTGGIALTDEGRIFLSRAHQVKRALDGLKTCLNGARPVPTVTHFAVGGTYALAAALLPSLLSELRKTHPAIKTVLRTGSSLTIHNEILRGDIEVGFVSKRPRSKRLEVQPYGTHTLVAFVHRSHPYARKDKLTAAELASAPLVLRGGHRVRSAAESVLKQRGYQLNVVFRGDTPEAVRNAVRDNWGVGILLRDAVKNAIERGEFKVLRVPGLVLEAKSFIVYHKERPLSPAATEFLTLLRKENPRRTTQEEFAGGGGTMLRIEGHDSAGYSRVKAATVCVSGYRQNGQRVSRLSRSPAADSLRWSVAH